MKPIHAFILFLAGLLALINSPANAQETPPGNQPAAAPDRPKAATPPPAAPAAPKATVPEERRGDRTRPKPANEKPTPFIGVLTTHVSPELRAQLGLAEGFGLQVVEVMPDSPAKEAGLKEHDILVKFEDQKLVTMEQLQALVRSKRKDDSIPFTVITGGKETQITVKVAERMMPVPSREDPRPGNRFFSHSERPQFGRPGDHPMMEESIERFQNRLREYQERLQEWSRNGHRGAMPTPPALDGFNHRNDDRRPEPRREEQRSTSDRHRSAGVTRRDDSGTYSLSRSDDISVFSVRPNTGGEQSWSFSNEAQRDMIPEQYRQKLRMLEEISEDMRRDGGPRTNSPPHPPGDRNSGTSAPDGARRPDAENRPRQAPPPPPAKRPSDTF